ncbi:MAG TPA: type II toxin-antitoxin system RelE/ParE family toxin, partial [Allosphingosinicella sp.]
VRLSKKARRDLKEIWRYGSQEWGEQQADAYARSLSSAMELLRERPGIGVDADLVLPNGRRWKVGSHHIYYFLDEAAVRIVRILAAKQDPVRQLR